MVSVEEQNRYLLEKINEMFNWCSIIRTSEKEIVSKVFTVSKEEVEEALDPNQPSKVLYFDGCIYVSLNVVEYSKRQVKSITYYVFFNNDNLVLLVDDFNDLFISYFKGVVRFLEVVVEKSTPGLAVYCLIDELLIRYYDIMARMEIEMDKLEITILKGPEGKYIGDIIRMRREVYRLKKGVNPLRYIVDDLLFNKNGIIAKENLEYFSNISRKTDKLISNYESLITEVNGVRQAFETETANRNNEIMKIFTLITSIFLPVNVISAIFGMNVCGNPFKDYEGAFFLTGVIILVITIVLVIVFRRKKWL